jgi:hypothetical protein
MEERIAELERRMSVNAFEEQKKLDELVKFQEKSKLNFLEVEKKLTQLEEKPSAPPVVQRIVQEPADSHRKMEERFDEKMRASGDMTKEHRSLEEKFEDRLRSIEDLLMLLEVEVVKSKDHAREPSGELMHQGVPKEMEEKLASLEKKLEIIEKAKLKIPAERLNLEDRLRSMEDNFLSLEGRVKEEVNRIDGMVAGKALTEESTERFVQKIHDRIEELRRDLDKAQLIKNEIVQREKDFARRNDFDNFQNFMVAEMGKLRQVVDRVAAMERSIDTHLIDIEEKVRTEVTKHSQSWRTDVAGHRRDVDLSVVKLEEKLLTVLGEEVKRIEQVMGNQRAEIENLIKVERQAEREMEARATRIVTKELAEFASLMDKRFPYLVSKNDFDKLSAEVLARIERVEAPDTGPILRRVEEMEKRLEDFARLITTIAQRMPLVIE